LVKRILGLLLLLPFLTAAQPNGYYNSAANLNGAPLRDALYNIIKNHTSAGYASLWNYMQQTDAKPNGKVWDIYSDKPGQTPPYQYTFVADQCGNYSAEGDCFNREHTFPQSYFNSAEPMKSDLFQVYPTDGFVNGKRADFMYGVVNSASYSSQNGSKVGSNSYPGSPSGNAFEPIDAYKGDLARTYFYFATRYKGEDNGWSDWEMANGAELKQWAINMLLDWHHNDTVSQKEKDRNNAIYGIQNNRNPFIDYPIFADCIWGSVNCSTLTASTPVRDLSLDIFPNPATNVINLRWKNITNDVTIDIVNLTGQKLLHKELNGNQSIALPVENWTKGVYLIYFRSEKTMSVRKVVIQ